jgi:hypothetical protein
VTDETTGKHNPPHRWLECVVLRNLEKGSFLYVDYGGEFWTKQELAEMSREVGSSTVVPVVCQSASTNKSKKRPRSDTSAKKPKSKQPKKKKKKTKLANKKQAKKKSGKDEKTEEEVVAQQKRRSKRKRTRTNYRSPDSDEDMINESEPGEEDFTSESGSDPDYVDEEEADGNETVDFTDKGEARSDSSDSSDK